MLMLPVPEKQKTIRDILRHSRKPEMTFFGLSRFYEASLAGDDMYTSLCSMVLLLEESKVLLLHERLAAWYILFACWPAAMGINPFITFMKRVMSPTSSHTEVERILCSHLISPRNLEEIAGMNPCVFLEGFEKPVSSAMDDENSDHLLLSSSSSQFRGNIPFSTPWERPEPGVLHSGLEDLLWLYPEVEKRLIWDSDTAGFGIVDNEQCHPELQTVRDLILRAIRGPLLPAQQQLVLGALDCNPRLATSLLTDSTSQLPSLVENCPAIATALLLKLFQQRYAVPQTSATTSIVSEKMEQLANEMLKILAHTDVSLHGMEVVNKLSAAVDLPGDFIHAYIVNCIQSCESTQDKYVQSRLVRLVCVFLHSLIRNRSLAATPLMHELSAFCINFSRIREAASLFRLLKQIEGCGLPGSISLGGAEDPQQYEVSDDLERAYD